MLSSSFMGASVCVKCDQDRLGSSRVYSPRTGARLYILASGVHGVFCLHGALVFGTDAPGGLGLSQKANVLYVQPGLLF